MSIRSHIFSRSALLALCAMASGMTPLAHAAAPAPGAAAPAAGPVAEAPQPVQVPGFGLPAAPAQLEHARGGSDGIVTNADLRGAVSGNSASQVVTGGNTISAGSFAGASGIPIVIQNSGANVLIQNATVINLRLQ